MLKTTPDQFKNIKNKPSTNTATKIFSGNQCRRAANDPFRSKVFGLNRSRGWPRIWLLPNLSEINPITDTLIRNNVVLVLTGFLQFCYSACATIKDFLGL